MAGEQSSHSISEVRWEPSAGMLHNLRCLAWDLSKYCFLCVKNGYMNIKHMFGNRILS